MRLLPLFAAAFLGLSAAFAPAANAQKPKPKPKPAATRPPVKGTTQLAGDNGQLGITYTVGPKDEELNFTLNSAEFSVARFEIGGGIVEEKRPAAGEKLLLLRFTVQNPQKQDMDFNGESFRILAVDAKDVNHESGAVARSGETNVLHLALKPAQKLDVVTAILVPAAGTVPKLIVQRGEARVLRYDLRGKIKALSAPIADPSDASGATARAEVPAKAAAFYPLSAFDLRLDGTAFTTETLNQSPPEEDARYFVANVTLRNGSLNRQYFTDVQPELTFADGEKADTGSLVKAARDEPAGGDVAPGGEIKVRLVFLVPKDRGVKTLTVREGESRAYVFDVSGTK